MPNRPKTTRDSLPSTLERSDDKAQETFLATLESARETYEGDEQASHRVAFAAVKHGFEKVGDHWEPKAEKGPSDDQAARGGGPARRGGPTAGGVDANASKAHLYELAQRLDVAGRSKMTKEELVEALQKANDRETARARRR
jgi:cation transport regulator ChaB